MILVGALHKPYLVSNKCKQRVVVQIISSKVLLLFMHAVLAWFGKRGMLQMPIFKLQHTKGLFFLFTMKKQPGSESKCAGVCNEEWPLALAWRMTEKYNYLIKDMSIGMYAS